jgi:predicted transcriptional regulator
MAASLSAEARVAQFAERVARRDTLTTPDPRRFEPDQVVARLTLALRRLLGLRQGAASPARMCYAFLEASELATPALIAAAGLGTIAGHRVVRRLRKAGLLAYRSQRRDRYYRLTRFGEDWLLAVAQDTEPPAPLVIGVV